METPLGSCGWVRCSWYTWCGLLWLAGYGYLARLQIGRVCIAHVFAQAKTQAHPHELDIAALREKLEVWERLACIEWCKMGGCSDVTLDKSGVSDVGKVYVLENVRFCCWLDAPRSVCMTPHGILEFSGAPQLLSNHGSATENKFEW